MFGQPYKLNSWHFCPHDPSAQMEKHFREGTFFSKVLQVAGEVWIPRSQSKLLSYVRRQVCGWRSHWREPLVWASVCISAKAHPGHNPGVNHRPPTDAILQTTSPGLVLWLLPWEFKVLCWSNPKWTHSHSQWDRISCSLWILRKRNSPGKGGCVLSLGSVHS